MGQLKPGITAMYKVLNEADPKLKLMREVSKTYADKVQELGSKLDQGYDVLHLYLIEKFKKAKTTVDAQKAKKLKDIMDSNIAGNIKGINQWKGDMEAKIKDLNHALKATTDPVVATLEQATTQIAQLKALAAKKSTKLFKSAKYKGKIKIYLSVLDGLHDAVEKQKKVAARRPAELKSDWVDKKYKISDAMTVGEVKMRAGAELDKLLKTYNENKDEVDGYVRKLRDEYKPIPGQLAVMKKWMEEADEMEAEGT
jgi:hypothetical protein